MPAGALLLCTRATIGELSIAAQPLATNQGFKNLICFDGIDNQWLYYAIQPMKLKMVEQASGSTFLEISKTALGNIEILTPPDKPEQNAIATALSDADALIDALEQSIVKKRQIKQGAMQELLTGKRRLLGFTGEWTTEVLSDLVDTDTESLTSKTSKTYTFNYISLEDVKCGELMQYSEYQFYKSPLRARRKISYGDLLISTVRPNLKSHLLFLVSDGEWVSSTGFCVVRCKKNKIDNKYLFQHFFAYSIAMQIENVMTGSNYPAINSAAVRSLEIPIPPTLEEQTAIAAVLSDMDDEIAALEAKLAKARQIKIGMMQELLTGRIRLV